jgi:hypothetical protein
MQLLSCNQNTNNQKSTNSQIPETMVINQLPQLLTELDQGKFEFDFFGITSNGIDCLYFVKSGKGFNIEYEAMVEDQKFYMKNIELFAQNRKLSVNHTTYNNKPQYKDQKYAPVLQIQSNADIESTSELAKKIMRDIFGNSESVQYEVVP